MSTCCSFLTQAETRFSAISHFSHAFLPPPNTSSPPFFLDFFSYNEHCGLWTVVCAFARPPPFSLDSTFSQNLKRLQYTCIGTARGNGQAGGKAHHDL